MEKWKGKKAFDLPENRQTVNQHKQRHYRDMKSMMQSKSLQGIQFSNQ
jgi:hypothetical protein